MQLSTDPRGRSVVCGPHPDDRADGPGRPCESGCSEPGRVYDIGTCEPVRGATLFSDRHPIGTIGGEGRKAGQRRAVRVGCAADGTLEVTRTRGTPRHGWRDPLVQCWKWGQTVCAWTPRR